jgi:dihydroorotate dehydrogenase (NAD+) catalytic subunit
MPGLIDGAVAVADVSDPARSVDSPVVRLIDVFVSLGDLSLANLVTPASGRFGPELADLAPVHVLGAVVTKTAFGESRSGNRARRVGETAQNMLNNAGFPAGGYGPFLRSGLPNYQRLGCQWW